MKLTIEEHAILSTNQNSDLSFDNVRRGRSHSFVALLTRLLSCSAMHFSDGDRSGSVWQSPFPTVSGGVLGCGRDTHIRAASRVIRHSEEVEGTARLEQVVLFIGFVIGLLVIAGTLKRAS